MNQLQAMEFVRNRYDVTEGELKGLGRERRIAKPRHVYMFLLKHFCDMSYPQIGRILSGRDHTSIMYGYNKIREEIVLGTLDLGIEIDLDLVVKKNNKKNLSTFDKSVKEALLIFRIKMMDAFNDDPFGTLIKLSEILNRKD